MKRSSGSTRSAFTLLELLAVISIVGVLLLLGFATLGKTGSAADNARCVQNLRQMGTAIAVYTSDNNGYLPLATEELPALNRYRHWFHALWDGALWYSKQGPLPNNNREDAKILTAYHCPANPYRIGPKWKWPNYAYNSGLGFITDNVNLRVRMAQLREPAKVVMMGDGGIRGGQGAANPPGSGPDKAVFHVTSATSWSRWGLSIGFDWHQQHANFLLADGHVESLTRAECQSRFDNGSLLWSGDNINSYKW